MSLLGKIMAVFNLLGVIAVFVMALLVYSKREAWSYAVYRHDLAMYGFPVTDADQDDQDYKLVLDLGSTNGRTLSELLPTNPVTTQVKEVERLKQILDDKLAAAGSDRTAQMQLYANTLLPLSLTNGERGYYIAIRTYSADAKAAALLQEQLANAYKATPALMRIDPKKTYLMAFDEVVRSQPVDPKGPFDEAFLKVMTADPKKPFDAAFNETLDAVQAELKARYDAAFQEALQGERSSADGTKAISLDQRRHAIAHLLFNLDESLPKDAAFNADAFGQEAFKRVVTLVGVKEANREMNVQGALLATIAQELEREIGVERSNFVRQDQALIAEARARSEALGVQDDDLKRVKAKVEAQNALVAERQKNVTEARTELAARRKYTSELIAIVRQLTDHITRTAH